MVEFLKKNKPTVITLGTALLIALVLIVMVVVCYTKIEEKIAKIDQQNSEIQRITSATNPRIVTENARRIKNDASELEAKTKTIQRVFGAIYDPAFDAFLDALRKNAGSNEELQKAMASLSRADFASELNAMVSEMETDDAFFPSEDFRKGLFTQLIKSVVITAPESLEYEARAEYEKAAAACFDAAFLVFKENLKKIAFEEITDDCAYGMFLQDLGLPRSFVDSAQFNSYLDHYADWLNTQKCIPFEYGGRGQKDIVKDILLGREIKPGDAAMTPTASVARDRIPYIVARCQIYENLFSNMTKAGVLFVSLKRDGDDKPDFLKDDSENSIPFCAYTYDMVVRGTPDQVRNFANNLHQEYRNNRVYDITSLTLSVDRPSERQADASPTKRSVDITRSLKMIEDRKKLVAEEARRSAAEAEAGEGASAEIDQASLLNEQFLDANYGAATIGANNQIYAVFKIRYIVFIGDQLDNKNGKER